MTFVENAYSLLGIRSTASREEIEAAYAGKKRINAPERFIPDTLEWQFARAREAELDKAYKYAIASLEESIRDRMRRQRFMTRDPSNGTFPAGWLIAILLSSPAAVVILQWVVPSILHDLASQSLRHIIGLLSVFIVLVSYTMPLLIRFLFLRRPLRGLAIPLLFFPLTLLFTDLFTSMFLHSAYLFRGQGFEYVPTFYLMGWAPLFVILYAHCAILQLPSRAILRESSPLPTRLVASTLALVFSVGLSIFLCAGYNRKYDQPPRTDISTQHSVLEEPWRVLDLMDAGTIEIPESWFVEDSNGKLHRNPGDDTIQYIREALTVRPYGNDKKAGLNYSLEILVYWWAQLNDRIQPPPSGALSKVQEHQLESLREEYPDLVPQRTSTKVGEKSLSVLTAETLSIPGYVVRFKHIAFEEQQRLYLLTVSYPEEEEATWEVVLDRFLWRWYPKP